MSSYDKVMMLMLALTGFIYVLLTIFQKKHTMSSRMDMDISILLIMLDDIPYIDARIIDKSIKNRYIKLSISVDPMGVVNALMGNSPLDKVKEQIKEYHGFVISNKKPYNIEMIIK